MITIKSFNNNAEASFFVSLLTANGIDAVLFDEHAAQFYASTLVVPIRLQVPDDQAEAALELIENPPDEESAAKD